MMPILYSFRRCPYAIRARMALQYAQIDVDHREILLKDKPTSMLAYSPKGTVPVLVVNEQVIDESLDVMMWALRQSDPDDWLLNKHVDRTTDMHGLIEQCDQQFKPQLDRYKYADRHELSEVEYRQQTLWFLSELNDRLIKDSYLLGQQLSLADVAIFPFIRQYAFVNKPWFDGNEYTALQSWLEKLLKWAGFLSVMEKRPLWSDEQ